jgi:hypothetical protein
MADVFSLALDFQMRSNGSMIPIRTYPETGGSVVEWRRTEQKFKGEEEEEESDDQNETVESQ